VISQWAIFHYQKDIIAAANFSTADLPWIVVVWGMSLQLMTP
jgi:hypothetical protein